MKKQVIFRIITVFLTAAWMAVIFYMSSQTADDSDVLSSGICYRLCEIFVKGFEEMDISRRLDMAASISFIVRKTAHFTEYTVLGILLACSFRSFESARPVLWPALTGSLYAVSDEIHQLFIPGRSGQIRDVCIDTAGVILGVLIVSFISKSIQKRRSG